MTLPPQRENRQEDAASELAQIREAYARLEADAEALRLEAGETTRDLLRTIERLRHAMEEAVAATAAHAAIEASNTGRLIGRVAGARARGRQLLMRWRGRPRRRPRAEIPAAVAKAPLGLNVAGYIGAESGLGEATRCSLRALYRAGLPVALNNVPGPQRTADTSFTEFTDAHPHPFNLVHLNADNMLAFARDRGPAYFTGRYTIGYWFWELEQFRPDWRSAFDHVDEVWVASEHTRQSIGQDAPVPVLHVPLGIPEPVIGPYGRAHFGLPDHAFIFLYTFDVSSHMERKNPLGALRAFRLAGLPHDEALLLLKFTNGHTDRPAVRRLAEAASGLNVVFLDGAMHRPELGALMQASDCCLSLHRAEGFGMTIAEMMAMDRPAIASAYSGNLDFMTPEVSRLVPVNRVRIARDHGPYLRGYTWADPNVEDAAAHKRDLAQHPDAAAELGARGGAHVRRVLNTDRTAALMKHRLAQIQAGRVETSGVAPPPDAVTPEYS